ncbi:MAG: CDP-glycerol:glycerophosphate glycerophosphotransferase [Oscillospiraceae bacterium]|jgi:glycosyltransferase involved in cell wall biosynthesis|nr:CDP-glycerol:glycerophosphate glycerophosphotransferase [Oscillospiraceae bacterium]
MENTYKRKATVIVPVYNVEKFLAQCLDSLVAQTVPQGEMEVLLLNDGSPDGSPAICARYAARYDWIRYFSKENEGLSATRNFGLRHAEGRYIFFLDSDDTLAPDTVLAVTDFFAQHEDEVDLVTYKIEQYQGGKKRPPHYRYRYLPQSGVYDLNMFPFIAQTTVNVCIKNRGEAGVFFDETPDFRHEDAKFCTEQLLPKCKIGYCARGEYRYNRSNAESIVATYFYPYFIFESTMAWFEGLFGQYSGAVPRYVQALFVGDLRRKTKESILLPTHYPPEQLARAKARVRALLLRVEDDIILTYPNTEVYHTQYFLHWKYEQEDMRFVAGPEALGLLHNDALLFAAKRVECVITKFMLQNNSLFLLGHLKSPVFSFTAMPQLYTKINGQPTEPLALRESSWSYYKTKVKTNTFWGFRLELPLEGVTTLAFAVLLEGHWLETSLDFGEQTPFQPKFQRLRIFRGGLDIGCEGDVFTFRKPTVAAQKQVQSKLRRYYLANSFRHLLLRERLARMAARQNDRRVWLYYDCANVLRDNGYDQFLHDIKKQDGVERYYVLQDGLNRSALLGGRVRKKHTVRFGSKRHLALFVQAEKVITAFAEPSNYIPFAAHQIPHVADFFHYDLIYLQHGVLHAHLPWKYALDRVNVDQEVISTTFEQRNLVENYGFTPGDLLPFGMPRYDRIDRAAPPKRTILYAPSWRKYLVGREDGGKWLPKHAYFKASAFFQQSQALLGSAELAALLEQYDYRLEVQLHPIFGFYKEHYSFPGGRVSFAQPGTPESDYAVCITDISSFVFDFAYLRRPILYFMPDLALFRAGLNDYSALDLPLEDGLGPLTETPEDALTALRGLLEGGCATKEPFRQRAEGLFPELNDCCENIYQALSGLRANR